MSIWRGRQREVFSRLRQRAWKRPAVGKVQAIKIVISKFLNRKFKGVRWMPRLKVAKKDVA
jgi:hypothetical protein